MRFLRFCVFAFNALSLIQESGTPVLIKQIEFLKEILFVGTS
jgi:hypothetical protein